jgi:hypothetical protein
MKLSIRSGLVVLWLFAGVLLISGIYATRMHAGLAGDAADEQSPGQPAAPVVEAQTPAQSPDSAVMSRVSSRPSIRRPSTVRPAGYGCGRRGDPDRCGCDRRGDDAG